MKPLLTVSLLALCFFTKAQSTTQNEYVMLTIGVKMIDDAGGGFALSQLELAEVSKTTVKGVEVLLRKLTRTADKKNGRIFYQNQLSKTCI